MEKTIVESPRVVFPGGFRAFVLHLQRNEVFTPVTLLNLEIMEIKTRRLRPRTILILGTFVETVCTPFESSK